MREPEDDEAHVTVRQTTLDPLDVWDNSYPDIKTRTLIISGFVPRFLARVLFSYLEYPDYLDSFYTFLSRFKIGFNNLIVEHFCPNFFLNLERVPDSLYFIAPLYLVSSLRWSPSLVVVHRQK